MTAAAVRVRSLVLAVACAGFIACGGPAEESPDAAVAGDAGTQPDAARPVIGVQPRALEFTPTVVGTGQPLLLTIANLAADVAGTAADHLQLLRPEIEPADAEFVVDFPPPHYSEAGVPPGGETGLSVRFTPRSPGQKSATLKIHSTDPTNPVVTVALSGRALVSCDYEVVPGRLSFGAVLVGESRELAFEVRNKATAPEDECLVRRLALSAASASTFTLVDGPLENAIVRGGESLSVPVRFAPTGVGLPAGEVELTLSSAPAPAARVELAGEGYVGALLMAPSELAFGELVAGCSSRQRPVTLYNVGTNAMTLEAISLEEPAPDFAIVQMPAPGFVLEAGASVDLKVVFTAGALGARSAAVLVQVSGVGAPYRLPLTASAVEPAEQTDLFAIEPQPKLDVLLVVDDSSSMADQQASLQSNAQKLYENLAASSVDFRVAVTTTSVDAAHGGAGDGPRPDANGCFVAAAGRPKVVTRSTPEAQAAFLENVAVGTAGNESPMLLKPALLALSEPGLSGCNAGFLRDEAMLAVVVLSDSGDAHDSQPVASYVEAFFGIKGEQRKSRFSYSAVVPRPQSAFSCSVETGAADNARASDAAAATGGLVADICEPDWGAKFGVGELAWGYRTRFFLSATPDLSQGRELVVDLDGVVLPPDAPDGTVRWRYDAAANAIDFQPDQLPPPGSTLSVIYVVACPQ